MTLDEERELAVHKAQLERETKKYEADLRVWSEAKSVMARATVEFGITCIRALVLINGGAIIAILTFLGSLWGRDSSAARKVAEGAGGALSVFVAGLGIAILTGFLAYLSQLIFAEMKSGN